jgi:geranylgeranyl pyrophosphate synthase
MNEYWHDLARPSLLSLTCEAAGGEPQSTTPVAVALTLISGAIDIHDDIIDQSKTKNGKPTVHGKFGKDIALLVGDALLFKGLCLLDSKNAQGGIPLERMRTIADTVKDMFFELGDAEASELKFRGDPTVSPKEYLRIIQKKAADVEAHTRIGAIIGGMPDEKVEIIGQYGRSLGMLILLRDDWMDIIDSGESRSRILKESLPLPLLYGLGHPAIKNEIKKKLRKKPLTIKDAQDICKMIERTDIPAKYSRLMNKIANNAVSKLQKLEIEAPALTLLLGAALL